MSDNATIIITFLLGFICGWMAMSLHICLHYAMNKSKALRKLTVEEYWDLKRYWEAEKK